MALSPRIVRHFWVVSHPQGLITHAPNQSRSEIGDLEESILRGIAAIAAASRAAAACSTITASTSA